jgi:hypothetical protein
MSESDRQGWEPSESASGDAWLGDEFVGGWPEEMAGPEYWAYRGREEIERAVIELVGKRTARDR